MNHEDIIYRIKVILAEKGIINLDKDVNVENINLIDSGRLESIQVIDLILSFEKEFDIEMNDENISVDIFEDISRMASFIIQMIKDTRNR